VTGDVELLDGHDFELRPTGRYAHGRAHVERLARTAGLTPIRCEPVALRREGDAQVDGLVWTLAAAGRAPD